MNTQYTYEPFGNTVSSGTSNANPYQFTGRENDPSGLYYMRGRYYHPTLQRFLSPDPLALSPQSQSYYLRWQLSNPALQRIMSDPVVRRALLSSRLTTGGDANLFRYAGNSPTNFNDPMGLFKFGIGIPDLPKCPPGGGGGGGAGGGGTPTPSGMGTPGGAPTPAAQANAGLTVNAFVPDGPPSATGQTVGEFAGADCWHWGWRRSASRNAPVNVHTVGELVVLRTNLEPVSPIASEQTHCSHSLQAGQKPRPTPLARQAVALIGAAVIGDVLKFGSPLFRLLLPPSLGDALEMPLQGILLCFVPYALRESRLPAARFPGALLGRRSLRNEQPTPAYRIAAGGTFGAGILVLTHIAFDLAVYALSVVGYQTPLLLTPRQRVQLPVMRQLASVPAPQLVLEASLMSLGAAVSEEILFRLVLTALIAQGMGALLNVLGLADRASVWLAIFLQACLFGLSHGASGGVAVWNALATGLVLGTIYVKYGLEAAVAAHAMYDTTVFLVLIGILKLVH